MDTRRRLLGHLWLQAALWLAIAVTANHGSAAWFGRFDLTEEGKYTLSQVARRTVGALERPLIARVFYTKGLKYPYNNQQRW